MCGRYSLAASPAEVAATFGLDSVPDLPPRYNIAPTQTVAVVRSAAEGERLLVPMRWGLIPSWAKDPAIGNRLINARAESLAEKPSFRHAYRLRRCLVVADGFYEWQRVGNRRQPFYLQLAGGGPFGFAGLWEQWRSPEGELVHSCTIITTAPNALLAPIHDRMPVIVPPDDYGRWLDPRPAGPEDLQPLLQPFAPEQMRAWPVSIRVNSPSFDAPACREPLEEPQSDLYL